METLQERVNLLSKEFEKLKKSQTNITPHSNKQQKYENCWNQSSSNNNNKVMTSSCGHNDQINTMVGKSKENIPNADDCQRSSTNSTKMDEKDFSPTSSTVPLMITTNTPSTTSLMWQDIEINNLTKLLNCTKPKKFFRLAVDLHDVKASLKNDGCLSINPHLFQLMGHYSKDIIDRYVLFQEIPLNNAVYSGCLIGVALVINAQQTPSSMKGVPGGDEEIDISYLSLSRTNRDLGEITMNEVGKIKEMLSTHVGNLKKKAVLPFISDIYVSKYFYC